MKSMVTQLPRVKEQLKALRKISYNEVKHRPAGIVDVEIGQLKPHDTSRALFVVTTSFAELMHKQKAISKVIKETLEGSKKAIEDFENEKITKMEFLHLIKELLIDPKLEVEDPEEEHNKSNV